MTSDKKSTQPTIAELMARYLQSPGLTSGMGESGEIEPYEVTTGFRADPREAWDDACLTITFFASDEKKTRLSPPASWTNVVSNDESVPAIPMAIGNYPQRVRDFSVLLQTDDLTTLRPSQAETRRTSTDQSVPSDVLEGFIQVGTLRLEQELDQAEDLLTRLESTLDEEWKPAWTNEKAALLWEQGNVAEAEEIWSKMPESVPVLFNRGMAALFAERFEEAKENLTKAVVQLPETSGWHHLGQLYLAVVHIHGSKK